MEQEKTEAENRRIVEFASLQQQQEENRMAKIQEREEAKQHLHKIVETTFSNSHPCIYPLNDTSKKPKIKHSSLFSSSSPRRLKRRRSSVKRWRESVRNFVWRNKKRLTGREIL